MTDSVMGMRNELPLYQYVEKCDSAYFRIAFDYMKPYISRRISETFPDNDTLRTVRNNALFIECRNMAMVLMTPDFVNVSPKNHQRTKVRYVDAVS